MIFATIGNEHKPFYRFNKLVLKISDLYPNENIVYQKGYTLFNHTKDNISDTDFFSRKDFSHYINQASLVFTHGGAGTLLQLAKIKKVPFVLPRLRKYREHVNSHQLETLLEFEKLGLAIEIEYPIKEESLLEKLNSQNNSVINKRLSNFDENSLIRSIKKDVEQFLKK